jgi:AcrR family transcriptional regulator
MQEASIDAIARSTGIARGLIYRQFASKDELFALTVTDYLAELSGLLDEASAGAADPVARLERCAEAYARFCLRYPAFLDCALSLMHRPARELQDLVSESVWLRLGQGIARCLDHVAQALHDGTDTGAFAVEHPDRVANLLWTQTLGAMHLARIGVGIRQLGPGVPGVFAVDGDELVDACVRSALVTAGARVVADQG